ncbi:glycosyl transferase [Desulfuromonas versatilis]|uniref:Glycosyl transferase n=1 Tax=Desulfuromonas versatilis TaxID=2802975 RepID=A0ABN6E363_9BACT|nr:nucleotidyltransferase family protein [Desulfuromonas versatilis]BCR06766.1 glycosyl transferase [Desulfuromonas versatilis]
MPQPVSAILLAAGRSQRMGRCKPLLPLGERSVIERCLESLHGSGLEEIVVVLGHAAEQITQALAGQPVTVTLVRNPDPDSDMAGSVRCGLGALDPAAQGVLVCLTDHPLVRPATVSRLLAFHRAHPGFISIPTCAGKKGHPTLFPRQILEELAQAPTLRHLVRRDPQRVRTLEVDDAGVVLDMDTPEDYRRALEIWAQQATLPPVP